MYVVFNNFVSLSLYFQRIICNTQTNLRNLNYGKRRHLVFNIYFKFFFIGI